MPVAVSPAVRATLTIEPRHAARAEDVNARCELVNDGDEAVVINVAPLSSPSLALELVDAQGEPVHLPPPPVPPADVPLAEVAPRERHSVQFTAFLTPWIPPGRYWARFRYMPGSSEGRWLEGNLWSEWVEFEHG